MRCWLSYKIDTKVAGTRGGAGVKVKRWKRTAAGYEWLRKNQTGHPSINCL
jgi:hypothetical protein